MSPWDYRGFKGHIGFKNAVVKIHEESKIGALEIRGVRDQG
jgi:hypothetical protein